MKIPKKIYLWAFAWVLMAILPLMASAQEKTVDSLQRLYQKSNADTNKVNIAIQLAELAHQQGNYTQALTYCQEGLTLAKELDFGKGQAASLHRLGTLWIDRGQHEKALPLLTEAVQLREKLGLYKDAARTLNNIGALYQDLKQYDKALTFLKKSLEILEKLQDEYAMALLYGNIGLIYIEQKKYIDALTYVQKSIQLREKIQDKAGLAFSLNYLGSIFQRQGKTEQALSMYLKALDLEKETQNLYLMIFSNYNIGEMYIDRQQFDKAEGYLNEAAAIAKQIGAPKELSNVYLRYARLDSARRDYQGAFNWYKLHKELADSVFTVEKTKQLAQLQTDFEVAEKESQIKSLAQQNKIQEFEIKFRNYLFLTITLFLLILGVVGYIIYQNRQLQNQFKIWQWERRWRRSQLNPHFFFNALAAIQDVVVKTEPFKAASFLAKFGKLMRNVLAQSHEEFVPLSQEMETLRNYIALQQLRFADQFEVNIVIDDTVDAEAIWVPSMLFQPVVENAIEHGLKPLASGGLLSIDIRPTHHHRLQFIIEDNGVGVKQAASTKDEQHQSFAMPNLQQTIHLLKQQFNYTIHWEIVDKSTETLAKPGTKVIFELPLAESSPIKKL